MQENDKIWNWKKERKKIYIFENLENVQPVIRIFKVIYCP